MMNTPFDFAGSLHVGTVVYVSPDEIKVQLEIDAPDAVALNAGTPRPFPRINSYLLVPSDTGYLVGQVEWITIENSQYPKRKGLQDFGLIDLPFPLRKLSLAPLGTLSKTEDKTKPFEFRRGVEAFPSVGDGVLFPTKDQLNAIVTSGKDLRVKIGTSPLAGYADVKIDPDRLFGRHIAVLGNTGSGKSCSVAGLIRWSIEAAKNICASHLNSRFIVLDPNGEYSKTFMDLNSKNYAIIPDSNIEQLKIPLWFFNSAEWCAFARATDKTQKPTIVQALRTVRSGCLESAVSTPSHEMRNFLRTLASIVKIEKSQGVPWGKFPQPKSFYEKIKIWHDSDLCPNDDFSPQEKTVLSDLRDYISRLLTARSCQYPTYDFSKAEIDLLLKKIQVAYQIFGGSDTDILPIDADVPKPFSGDSFLRSIEANAELLNVSDYIETMLMRMKTILSDVKLKSVICDTADISLTDWLKEYIGDSQTSQITIIDLSLLPTEVIHIVTAVIARMTFEALQRYRRLNAEHKVLPTVLVMEEAHTFIKRYNDDAENHDSAAMCCRVFEKIAREGRKFGLGLVLSSQRPSELSPTVLSQCNTFLLHRISNDKDQELVHRLLPDNLRGLLRDLPTLPSRNAILLGWASELPVLVRMNELSQEQRPRSDDPDFWNVWTRKIDRHVNWQQITEDWQGTNSIDEIDDFQSSSEDEDNSTADTTLGEILF
jgi:DNA helicase HerA-like ATPase